MRDRPPAAHSIGASRSGRAALPAIVGLAILWQIQPASARQYGPGDIGYLVNLWNTNQERFKGVVAGVDTFAGLGTLKTLSKSADGRTADVVVDVGLNGRITCRADAGAVAEGDTVTVTGRIATATTAVSQMATRRDADAGDRPRDVLGLQSCSVQRALQPPKH